MSVRAAVMARATLEMRLPAAGQSVLFKLAVWPLSLLYGAVTRARALLYDFGLARAERLPGRVISIGNIGVGGTGKSPVAIWLANELLMHGHRPAILTRGYGSGLAPSESLAILGGTVVMHARSGHSQLPDEGRMQSVALPSVPVIVGAGRHAAALRFLAEHPDRAPTHWILDDGFQHRAIARDVDIVLLDAHEPWGNGAMLPRGTLREHPRALGRAHAVLFTRATDKVPRAADTTRAGAHGATVAAVRFAPGLPEPAPRLSSTKGAPPPAFCRDEHTPVLVATGIARPETLRAALAAQGIAVASALQVADHAALDRTQVVQRLAAARAVVTTAKDYWRDPSVFAALPKPAFVVPLALTISEDDRVRILTLVAP